MGGGAQISGGPGGLLPSPTATAQGGGKGGGSPAQQPSLYNSTPSLYQNSGLSRFTGNMNPFMPAAYTPQRYMPPSLNFGGGLGGGAGGSPVDTGPIMGGNMNESGVGTSADTTSSGGFGFSATPGQIGRGIGIVGSLAGIPGLGFAADALGLSRGISDYGAMNNNPDYSHEGNNYGAGGYGYGGDSGIGSGPGGADGNAGDAGSSDAGSTGAGSDTGSDAGQGGDGTGSGGDSGDGGDGWARGGWVTRDRLRGRNPRGPDDGYGALDVGEFVVPKNVAQQLGAK